MHVAKGTARVNGELLRAGDAAAIDDAGAIEIAGQAGQAGQEMGEVLLFDLA